MKSEWKSFCFECVPYRESGVSILAAVEDVQQMLDDHILKAQTMHRLVGNFQKWNLKKNLCFDVCIYFLSFHQFELCIVIQSSAYIKPFEEEMKEWEDKLLSMQDILDAWLRCQESWLYLEPIFNSEDIMKQMPVEGRKFNKVCDW